MGNVLPNTKYYTSEVNKNGACCGVTYLPGFSFACTGSRNSYETTNLSNKDSSTAKLTSKQKSLDNFQQERYLFESNERKENKNYGSNKYKNVDLYKPCCGKSIEKTNFPFQKLKALHNIQNSVKSDDFWQSNSNCAKSIKQLLTSCSSEKKHPNVLELRIEIARPAENHQKSHVPSSIQKTKLPMSTLSKEWLKIEEGSYKSVDPEISKKTYIAKENIPFKSTNIIFNVENGNNVKSCDCYQSAVRTRNHEKNVKYKDKTTCLNANFYRCNTTPKNKSFTCYQSRNVAKENLLMKGINHYAVNENQSIKNNSTPFYCNDVRKLPAYCFYNMAVNDSNNCSTCAGESHPKNFVHPVCYYPDLATAVACCPLNQNLTVKNKLKLRSSYNFHKRYLSLKPKLKLPPCKTQVPNYTQVMLSKDIKKYTPERKSVRFPIFETQYMSIPRKEMIYRQEQFDVAKEAVSQVEKRHEGNCSNDFERQEGIARFNSMCKSDASHIVSAPKESTIETREGVDLKDKEKNFEERQLKEIQVKEKQKEQKEKEDNAANLRTIKYIPDRFRAATLPLEAVYRQGTLEKKVPSPALHFAPIMRQQHTIDISRLPLYKTKARVDTMFQRHNTDISPQANNNKVSAAFQYRFKEFSFAFSSNQKKDKTNSVVHKVREGNINVRVKEGNTSHKAKAQTRFQNAKLGRTAARVKYGESDISQKAKQAQESLNSSKLLPPSKSADESEDREAVVITTDEQDENPKIEDCNGKHMPEQSEMLKVSKTFESGARIPKLSNIYASRSVSNEYKELNSSRSTVCPQSTYRSGSSVTLKDEQENSRKSSNIALSRIRATCSKAANEPIKPILTSKKSIRARPIFANKSNKLNTKSVFPINKIKSKNKDG